MQPLNFSQYISICYNAIRLQNYLMYNIIFLRSTFPKLYFRFTYENLLISLESFAKDFQFQVFCVYLFLLQSKAERPSLSPDLKIHAQIWVLTTPNFA